MNKPYQLTSGGGKISAALCQKCQPGQGGESLLRDGLSQESFNLFIAREVRKMIAAKLSDEQIADILGLLSASNASAASQALARCAIRWALVDKEGKQSKDDKGVLLWEANEISVGKYWEKTGGSKAAPNLSALNY